MIDASLIVLVWLGILAIFAAALVYGLRRNRATIQRKKAWLQASFDALTFDTPAGRVHGSALTVVKIAHTAATSEVPDFSPRSPQSWDAFWYAVGPGPSYFLAICMITSNEPTTPPRWAIRPLDEARMRAALAGDRQAHMLAFGEAIKA